MRMASHRRKKHKHIKKNSQPKKTCWHPQQNIQDTRHIKKWCTKRNCTSHHPPQEQIAQSENLKLPLTPLPCVRVPGYCRQLPSHKRASLEVLPHHRMRTAWDEFPLRRGLFLGDSEPPAPSSPTLDPTTLAESHRLFKAVPVTAVA